MSFKITKVDKKTDDWILVSLLNAAGDIVPNVSINRTNEKSGTFPGFDDIQEGNTIEGLYWVSKTGKSYLFPPKDTPKRDQSPAVNNGATAELSNILKLAVIPRLDKILAGMDRIHTMFDKFDPNNPSTKIDKALDDAYPDEEPTF